jgi:hypothetical protein
MSTAIMMPSGAQAAVTNQFNFLLSSANGGTQTTVSWTTVGAVGTAGGATYTPESFVVFSDVFGPSQSSSYLVDWYTGPEFTQSVSGVGGITNLSTSISKTYKDLYIGQGGIRLWTTEDASSIPPPTSTEGVRVYPNEKFRFDAGASNSILVDINFSLFKQGTYLGYLSTSIYDGTSYQTSVTVASAVPETELDPKNQATG